MISPVALCDVKLGLSFWWKNTDGRYL